MNKPPYELYLDLYPSYVKKVQPKLVKEGFWSSAVILLASIVGVGIICLFSSCGMTPARAEVEYSDEQIVNATWVIEGGHKAQYAYGIRSVKYSSLAEARRICLRTVANNRVRFTKQNEYKDYLDFLASRYCPTKGNLSKAESRLNKYWLGNLKKQLAKSK